MKKITLSLLAALFLSTQPIAFAQDSENAQSDAVVQFRRSLELKAKMLNLPVLNTDQIQIEAAETPNSDQGSVAQVQKTDSGIGIRLNTKNWNQVRSESERNGIMDRVTEAMLRVGFEKHDFVQSAGFGLIYRLPN